MTTINPQQPDWFVLVENNEADTDDDPGKVWIHVSDAVHFCIEDTRYGYPVKPVHGQVDVFADCEAYQGPTPQEA